jgi:hypothetical protein
MADLLEVLPRRELADQVPDLNRFVLQPPKVLG